MKNNNAYRLVITLFCLMLLTVNSHAKEYNTLFVTEVTSVFDADTFRVNIKDVPPIIGQRMPVRILGVDAPEIRGKCQAEKVKARLAKQFTVEQLRSAKIIELRNVRRGKYFRLLANVYIDGKNLADSLIQAGHARAYEGGKRQGWCQ